MKIYCSNNISDIEEFIGTDLWVRMYSRDWDRDEYVKIANTRQADWDHNITMIDFYTIEANILEMVSVERVTQTMLDRLYGYYVHNYHEKELSRGLSWFFDTYSLKEPIDILTDEEVHSCFDEICENFKRYL